MKIILALLLVLMATNAMAQGGRVQLLHSRKQTCARCK